MRGEKAKSEKKKKNNARKFAQFRKKQYLCTHKTGNIAEWSSW